MVFLLKKLKEPFGMFIELSLQIKSIQRLKKDIFVLGKLKMEF